MTANQIKRLRQRMDMSIRQFAAEVGVNKNTILNWEDGRTSPRGPALKVLEHLAQQRRKGS